MTFTTIVADAVPFTTAEDLIRRLDSLPGRKRQRTKVMEQDGQAYSVGIDYDKTSGFVMRGAYLNDIKAAIRMQSEGDTLTAS